MGVAAICIALARIPVKQARKKRGVHSCAEGKVLAIDYTG